MRFRAQAWAHPRSRGENNKGGDGNGTSPGSSPLTRGKPGAAACTSAMLGLIPAHAGKTKPAGEFAGDAWAHPRSRGENRSVMGVCLSAQGSSPLTRGKHEKSRSIQDPPRLIPAHAGKTLQGEGPRRPWEAHPRSRGENSANWTSVRRKSGSSPLTRGKRESRLQRRRTRGLIPAHAGKTLRWTARRNCAWAHPRSRGENTNPDAPVTPETGSSPLTRGKPAPGSALGQYPGLIPAHAGKTTPPPEAREPLWAHPRSRGENAVSCCQASSGAGSSPLTRGKRHGRALQPVLDGLIPAHAGKTYEALEDVGPDGAHPRSRGENIAAAYNAAVANGSSPLTRGKLTVLVQNLPLIRLIPAHAGKTHRRHRCPS